LRVLSAGRGHFSPERSNLVMVISGHARIIRASSIAKRALYIPRAGKARIRGAP
jgi:hypothetical protein